MCLHTHTSSIPLPRLRVYPACTPLTARGSRPAIRKKRFFGPKISTACTTKPRGEKKHHM
ncbi:hypothetical protein COCC4DRAFT_33865, partial [Bipolaris maydis ATCC 48331]